MIKLRSLISEQKIARLVEAPPLKTPVDASNTNYAEMSNEDLWDTYYVAKAAYDAQVLRSTQTPTNAVNAAMKLGSSGTDISRPLYWPKDVIDRETGETITKDYEKGNWVYIPAWDKRIPTDALRTMWDNAGKNTEALKKELGFDASLKAKSTTDNTCAQFACTAFDMGNEMTDDNIGGLLTHQKDLDWDAITSKKGHISGQSGYQSSPYKIRQHTIGDDKGRPGKKTKHPGNWNMTTSSDFEGDSRSAEWWAANIQPGDMILYKNTSGKGGGYDHVAMAGNNPLELWQDGSTDLTPGQRNAVHDHTNTHKGKEFDIIRYTNAAGINTAQTRMDDIQAALKNRPMEPLAVQSPSLAPKVPSEPLKTIPWSPEPQKAGRGNIFQKMYKSVKDLGNPDKFWG